MIFGRDLELDHLGVRDLSDLSEALALNSTQVSRSQRLPFSVGRWGWRHMSYISSSFTLFPSKLQKKTNTVQH